MHETENFELPVTYSGEEILLPGTFSTWGYSHRITFHIKEVLVHFEPDEERNYRAMLADASQASMLDQALVQAIAEALEHQFKD